MKITTSKGEATSTLTFLRAQRMTVVSGMVKADRKLRKFDKVKLEWYIIH